jgi:hypothetical protein
MAAGDDISLPRRTTTLVETLCSNPKVHAVFSAYRPIQNGHACPPIDTRKRKIITRTELTIRWGGTQKGATYAYRKRCLVWPFPLPDWVIYEDSVLPYRAALLGRVAHCPEILVDYREQTSVNNVPKIRPKISQDAKQWELIRGHLRHAGKDNTISLASMFYLIILSRYMEMFYSQSNGKQPLVFSTLMSVPWRVALKIAIIIDTTLARIRKENW